MAASAGTAAETKEATDVDLGAWRDPGRAAEPGLAVFNCAAV